MQSMKLVGGRAGPGVQAGPVSSSCPAGMQTTPALARRHPGNGKLAALQVLGRPGTESCCPSPRSGTKCTSAVGGTFLQTESTAVMTQWLLPAEGRANIVGLRLGFGDRPRLPGCTPAVARKESSARLVMLGQDRHPAKRTARSCSP